MEGLYCPKCSTPLLTSKTKCPNCKTIKKITKVKDWSWNVLGVVIEPIGGFICFFIVVCLALGTLVYVGEHQIEAIFTWLVGLTITVMCHHGSIRKIEDTLNKMEWEQRRGER